MKLNKCIKENLKYLRRPTAMSVAFEKYLQDKEKGKAG